MLTRYPIGLAATAIALAVAGRRLFRLSVSSPRARPAPDRLAQKSGRGTARARGGGRTAPAAPLEGARPRACLHLLGLLRADPHDRRGLRRAVPADASPSPASAMRPSSALPRTSPPARFLSPCSSSASSACRASPKRKDRASRFYGSHTATRLDNPRDDRPRGRHAPRVPRGSDQHGRLPLRLVGFRLPRARSGAGAARYPPTGPSKRSSST